MENYFHQLIDFIRRLERLLELPGGIFEDLRMILEQITYLLEQPTLILENPTFIRRF